MAFERCFPLDRIRRFYLTNAVWSSMIKSDLILNGGAVVELQQLKYFKTVAEIGKISDAAQALFISPPALSTSVARLERELGVQLFGRTNNRITLNQQGEIFLRYVNQVFYNLECAKVELRNSAMPQHRHICIASVSSTQLVDVITAFSQEHPGFTLQCTSLNRAELNSSGFNAQHSFLLASDGDVPTDFADKLERVYLCDDYPVVMVSPDHPVAQKGVADLRELIHETIFMPFQDYPLYDQLVNIFYSNGIPLPTGNAYSHLVTQQMVAKGLGIAFATMLTGRTPSLSLSYVPIKNDYQPWSMYLYWRKGHVFSEDEQEFRDFVIRYYRSEWA